MMKFLYRMLQKAKTILKWAAPQTLHMLIKKIALFQRFYAEIERGNNIREWLDYRMQRSRQEDEQAQRGGVNIIGYLSASKGISEAARNNGLALASANIPFTYNDYDVGVQNSMKADNMPFSSDGAGFKFNANLIHINPPQFPSLWGAFSHGGLASRYTIGVWYWELPDFPEKWSFAFDLVDELWAASDFLYEGFSARSPIPVVKIPPCVHPIHDLRLKRVDFMLPDNRFLFMCAYDMMSEQDRKNPLAAVEAFKRAFPKNDLSVGLVVKVNNAQENPRGLDILKDAMAGFVNCHLITDVYKKKTLNSLVNLTDAYISLHRSEGFGLIPAEAMSFGKPAILTRWSGNLDYMTPENSCGVDYELIPVGRASGPYGGGQVWADPDIDHAVYFMRKLFSDRNYYQQVSTHARKTIKTEFSPMVVGGMVRERLTLLGLLH